MKIDKINLLAKGSRENFPISIDEILLLIFICFMIVATIVTLVQQKNIKKVKEEVSLLTKNSSEISQKITLLSQERENRKYLKLKKDSIKDLFKNDINWSDYFKEMSLLIPKDSWLIYFILEQKKEGLEIEIQGKSIEAKSVSNFFNSLSNSLYYNNLNLKFSEYREEQNQPSYSFSFTNRKGGLGPSSLKEKDVSSGGPSNPLKEMMMSMENEQNKVNNNIQDVKNQMNKR